MITTDQAFGSDLREVARDHGWNFRHATTVKDATPVLMAEPLPLVVYDGQKGEDDWQPALDYLRRLSSERCILLASPAADPYLWQEVIRRGGFDLFSRSASREEIGRKLSFAWFCMEHSRKQER